MATIRIWLDGSFLAAHDADALDHPEGRLHGYQVRVALEYPDTGAAVNWDGLRAALDGKLALLERKLLTGIPGLASTSVEDLARFLFARLSALDARVAAVEVSEGGGCGVVVSP